MQGHGGGRRNSVCKSSAHWLIESSLEGNGNPLRCSCLENPRDCGAWWAAICGVAQSRTRLKRLGSSSHNARAPTYAMGCQVVKVASWILGPLEALGELPLALCSYPSVLWKQQGQMPCPAVSWSPKSANKMSYVWPSIIWAGTPAWQIATGGAQVLKEYKAPDRETGVRGHTGELQGVASTLSLHINQVTYYDKWSPGKEVDSTN